MKPENLTCYNCAWNTSTCCDPHRTAPCISYITREALETRTKKYYKELQEAAKANGYRWTIPVEKHAELMGSSKDAAEGAEHLICRVFHLSERQGGELVIE